jgi:hypothetical protein
MTSPEDHSEILRLLRENRELVEENNKLLRKLYKHNVIGFTVRIIWYIILLGLPFALYFTILEPYFEALGANYSVFKAGMEEIPGVKGFEQLLPFLE